MTTTRTRKLAFIGDKYALSRAVGNMLIRQGADWLTDEQVVDLVRATISSERFAARIKRKNRRQVDDLRADELFRDHARRARIAEERM